MAPACAEGANGIMRGSFENVTMFVWASRCKGSDAIIHVLSWSQTIPCAEAKSSESLT